MPLPCKKWSNQQQNAGRDYSQHFHFLRVGVRGLELVARKPATNLKLSGMGIAVQHLPSLCFESGEIVYPARGINRFRHLPITRLYPVFLNELHNLGLSGTSG